MKSFELEAETALGEFLMGGKGGKNKARIMKVTQFIESLDRNSQWIRNNVKVVDNLSHLNPPRQYMNGPYEQIGSSAGIILWAVVTPEIDQIKECARRLLAEYHGEKFKTMLTNELNELVKL